MPASIEDLKNKINEIKTLAEPPDDILKTIKDLAASFNFDGIKDLLTNPLNDIKKKVEDIIKMIPQLPSLPGSDTSPPPSTGETRPVDPSIVLNAIAKGITDAETVLNKQFLVINSCEVEANLSVKIPGLKDDIAGANTKINFKINPKPYN